MRFARALPYVFLALLVWGTGLPVIAVTCVPSVPCASLVKKCPRANSERSVEPVMKAPDCCAQSLRESQLAAIPGAKVQELAPDDGLAAALAVPPAPQELEHRAVAEPIVSRIPLYTLHSILLI